MASPLLSQRFIESSSADFSSLLREIDVLLGTSSLDSEALQSLRRIRASVETIHSAIRNELYAVKNSDPEATKLNNGERRVAHLLIKGLLTREISRSLHISEATVKTHLASIYRKLEVRNRAEAIHALLLNGFQ